jgi:hypothetical protein
MAYLVYLCRLISDRRIRRNQTNKWSNVKKMRKIIPNHDIDLSLDITNKVRRMLSWQIISVGVER